MLIKGQVSVSVFSSGRDSLCLFLSGVQVCHILFDPNLFIIIIIIVIMIDIYKFLCWLWITFLVISKIYVLIVSAKFC